MQKLQIDANSINANSSLPSIAMSPHWAWSIIEEWRWCLRWWSRDLLSRCIAGGWMQVVYAKLKFWNDTTSMIQIGKFMLVLNCQWNYDIWHHITLPFASWKYKSIWCSVTMFILKFLPGRLPWLIIKEGGCRTGRRDLKHADGMTWGFRKRWFRVYSEVFPPKRNKQTTPHLASFLRLYYDGLFGSSERIFRFKGHPFWHRSCLRQLKRHVHLPGSTSLSFLSSFRVACVFFAPAKGSSKRLPPDLSTKAERCSRGSDPMIDYLFFL